MKALWALQSHCTYGCKYCYFRVQEKRPSYIATLPMIEKIGATLGKMGIRQVLLSGGEPLDSQYWQEAIRECTNREMDVILTTNGAKLTIQNVEALVSLGAKGVIVSLDSYRSDYHNHMRPLANHEKAVAALREAIRVGERYDLRVGVCTVLTKENLADLHDTITFANDLGVNYFKFQVIHVPDNNRELAGIALTRDDYNRLLNMLDFSYSAGHSMLMPVRDKMQYTLSMLRDGRTDVSLCWAGTRLVFVSETGEFFPCPVFSMLQPNNGIENGTNKDCGELQVNHCSRFSSDCACLWEVAFQDKFI